MFNKLVYYFNANQLKKFLEFFPSSNNFFKDGRILIIITFINKDGVFVRNVQKIFFKEKSYAIIYYCNSRNIQYN